MAFSRIALCFSVLVVMASGGESSSDSVFILGASDSEESSDFLDDSED